MSPLPFIQPTVNDRGDVVFTGIVETEHGIHIPGETYIGLGAGLYQANHGGSMVDVVIPGDPAPGRGTFDFLAEGWVNAGGDISFEGHVAGEDTEIDGFPPQDQLISALTSLYLKRAGTGEVISIVHAGDPAPGGGAFRQVFHDVMNDRGDIAFIGDLTPPPRSNQTFGVFLYTHGDVLAIARPGDPLPGGGVLLNPSIVGGNDHVNNEGDVVFSAQVDVGDGSLVTGLYQWSNGALSVVARTGTVIPGVGTIDQLASPQMVVPPPPVLSPTSGAINNNRGQVVFQATLTDGRGVMLLATPQGNG